MPTADSWERKLNASKKSPTSSGKTRRNAARAANRAAGRVPGSPQAARSSGGGGSSQRSNTQAQASAPAPRSAPNLNPKNALKDPLYNYYMNEALGTFRRGSVNEQERLANLYTSIFGETGQLKTFDTQSTQDQRRLAAEMAARGTLQSGAYAGGERGLGTLQQKEQAAQRAGIERNYTDQTSPQALFEMGLFRGPDNKVRELVQGETVSWTDPNTGEAKTMKYDWTETTAGRAAKQAALQQWMNKQLAGVTSVI